MTDGSTIDGRPHVAVSVAATEAGSAPLVLLHGSDGVETDLLPLADELAPGAAKLGVRGTVATDDGHAFFHRFPDRRINEADVAARAPVLAEFIRASCTEHGLTGRPSPAAGDARFAVSRSRDARRPRTPVDVRRPHSSVLPVRGVPQSR